MLLNRQKVSEINKATTDKAIRLFLDALIKKNQDMDKKTLCFLINNTVEEFLLGAIHENH